MHEPFQPARDEEGMDGNEGVLFGDLDRDDRGGHQAVRSWLHTWGWETREACTVGDEHHVVGRD